ncbi:MAG: hypothetical protein AAGJ81_03700 [Verrucomicrobiota bacterium]
MKEKYQLILSGMVLAAAPVLSQTEAELEELEKDAPLTFLDELKGEANFTAGWDSIYLAEGRDDLGDGGLVYAEFSGTIGPAALGTWFADGTEVDYNEWNIFGELSAELADGLEGYIGYTHLIFFDDGERSDDDELGVGLTYVIHEFLETAVDAVYSFEAGGAFLELGLGVPVGVTDSFSLAPNAILGLDFGYRTDEYDGWNHFQVGIDAEYSIGERLAIGGYAAYAFALEDIDREEDETGEDIGDNPAFGVFASISF